MEQLHKFNLKKTKQNKTDPFPIASCFIQIYVCGLFPNKSIYASGFTVECWTSCDSFKSSVYLSSLQYDENNDNFYTSLWAVNTNAGEFSLCFT